MKPYKIIAITQVYNELRKGNLERYIKYIKSNVDAFIIYDDASTDGSYEYAKQYTPHVIRGTKNDFKDEWSHKKLLFEKALTLKPDFILSIDADEVLTDENGEKLQELAQWVNEKNLDGAYIHDINLWKSTNWKRVDSDFNTAYFNRFWKVTPLLSYNHKKTGLHQTPEPDGMKKIKKTNIVSFLHFGFADEKNIAFKYLNYAKLGQKGEDLGRIINESNLKIEKVEKNIYPFDLWKDDKKPEPYTSLHWQQILKKYEPLAYKPSISIVCLIYQSTEWLQFVYNQVIKYTDLRDKEFFFIANDATPEVKDYLYRNYIPHYIFENTPEQKKEWYINNVYRAWNFGAKKAQGDLILFINSDMAFSPNWVEDLLEQYDGNNCVSSRLVESGNLQTGGLCIEKNFGKHISEYKESEFLNYVNTIKKNELHAGGAYMPLLIKKDNFIQVGGYPEGNAKINSDIFLPQIAKKGDKLISGDIILMEKLKTINIQHQTSFNSIIYHFQEGEMRDIISTNYQKENTDILIINNSLRGRMGEKVMWNYLLDNLPNVSGIDQKLLDADENNFSDKLKSYIIKNFPDVKIIIQNASFIDIAMPNILTVVYLQDNLRGMNRISLQQENNLAGASEYVSNTINTACFYPEYKFNIIPIGVNEKLFKPADKNILKKQNGLVEYKKIGIFVGDLSEVKGWSKIKELITTHQEIQWLVVSKDDKKFTADNVIMFNQISQDKLAELYQCADFFILGSNVETQCLAAIEACLCDTPVIMKPIGVFADFLPSELEKCGIFTDDFENALTQIYTKSFTPRKIILDKKFDTKGMIENWWQLISQLKLHKILSPIQTTHNNNVKIKIKRKLKMIFMNKTFIIITLKKYLPANTYEALLKIWRFIKKIKLLLTINKKV